MNETRRKLWESYGLNWRKELPFLLDCPLFDKKYWKSILEMEIEEGGEIEKELIIKQAEYSLWGSYIEQIWAFCVLVDSKNSPAQDLRKNYGEKINKAIEVIELPSELGELIKEDKLTFVNEIRAWIGLSTCDLEFQELMDLYRLLYRNNLLLFKPINELEIDKQIKAGTDGMVLRERMKTMRAEIIELEDFIFGKSEKIKSVGVRKGQRELGTSIFYIPSEKFSATRQGERYERDIEQEQQTT